MMMKKYASLLFALVLALSLSVSAAADSSGVYVYDDAALLTQEEYDTLTASAMAVADQYGCGVYVVTVDDMADYIDPDAVTETGETGMAAFTEYAWDALGLAASYDSNGIMLALSMAERDFQMLAHGDTANAAFDAGATHMTHLYNAMPGITHREPGPIIAALERGAEVELITDNVHIHPAMVRFTFNTFGDDHVILIADSMMACGLPDGQYSLGGQAVTVSGPRATLTEHPGTIAGSATCLYDCMKRAVLEMNVPLESAVRAASENPAKSIGIDNDYGSLAAGRYGNVILADKELNIQAVYQKGTRIV